MFSIFAPKTAPSPKITKVEKKHSTYSQFIRSLDKKEVQEVVFKPNSGIAEYLTKEGEVVDAKVVANPELWKSFTLSDAEVQINLDPPPASFRENFSTFLVVFFFLIILRSIFGIITGNGGGGPGIPMMQQEFAMDREVTTRLSDVEGIDSAKRELEEIVTFLREPEKFVASGARIPRGAVLTGLPGTGKTLLARAIAGESAVPFIDCSASSFVEMFVGVGAKRVRDLFALAREHQPCIVFIDELDAIGKQRTSGGPGSNDEREQTLNQILTEMDGFDEDSQIIVLAATNRIDVLDDALLRPGRFDRKIEVALPSRAGRERILGVHAKGKTFAPDVDLSTIAAQTTGFSGAELANMLNECAIASVTGYENAGVITNEIVEDTFQRLVVGARGDAVFSQEKKDLVAYHEAGHAIVGALMSHYDTLRKVSIIPRGDAGGITFFQPNEDIDLYSKDYFYSKIRVALGGRVAEEIVYGAEHITTGASGDYQQVYSLARRMVTEWGFGEHNYDYANLSEFSKRQLDREIDALVKQLYDETRALLTKHRADLESLKHKLIAEEVVEGEWVLDLIKNYHSVDFYSSHKFETKSIDR